MGRLRLAVASLGTPKKPPVALARHSDDVLGMFLAMAGGEELMAATKLAAAERAIEELLAAVRRLTVDDEPDDTEASPDEADFTVRQ